MSVRTYLLLGTFASLLLAASCSQKTKGESETAKAPVAVDTTAVEAGSF